MELTKKTYVSGETVITAQNMNDIQDAIIDLENNNNDNGNAAKLSYTVVSTF